MTRRRLICLAVALLLGFGLVAAGLQIAFSVAQEPPKPRKIILIAGKKSHGPVGNGIHDYGWSARLLKVMLESSNIKDRVAVEVYLDDGPADLRVYDSADAVMVISDGRDGDKFAEAPHLASEERVRYFDGLMKKGCGFLSFHFSTFTPDKYAEQIFNWSGGYFGWEEKGQRKWYSAIQTLDGHVELGTPDHPIARGVRPFKMKEEFYHNLRFKPGDAALKPILVVPALKGREPDGNIVAWAREREGGGRGFGTTCGHFYDNWKNDAFRKLMLNAIAWSAKVEVPKDGVEAKFYSHEEIDKVLGPYPKAGPPNPPAKPEEKKAASDPKKSIRVLLLAGNDQHKWHNWEKTTPAIKDLLERDPRIAIDVSLDIEDLARKKLTDYQVIVQNYVNWQDPKGLSEAAQKAFVQFLRDGGGLVVVHFANGAFHSSLPGSNGFDWPEYRKMVRRVWNHNTPAGQPKSGHDAFGRFTVRITDLKHPITDGLKPFEVADELYFDQDGTEPIEPLIAAESKVTKKLEPLAWAGAYGRGRVFQTLLGHSEKTYETYEARELLRRSVAWCAGQEVRPLDPAKEAKPAPPAVGTGKGDHFGTDGVGFRWTEGDSQDDRWKDAQIGRFLASALPLPLGRGTVGKGLSIRLGDKQEAAVCYDTENLKLRAGWTGGFLRFTPARFGLISPPEMAGKPQLLSGPGSGWLQAQPQYSGLHLQGDRVVLDYRVMPQGKPGEPVAVLETPWIVHADGLALFTRTLEIGPSAVPLTMQVTEGPRAEVRREGDVQLALSHLEDKAGSLTTAYSVVGGEGVALTAAQGTITLSIPAHREPIRLTLLGGAMVENDLPRLAALSRSEAVKKEAAFDFKDGAQPGPPRWTAAITTRGIVAPADGPYVVDTLTLPIDNPYKALLFVSGHDFFANGDIALCTVHGDVWRVGGVNARLEKLSWKRYATGLFQPLGLKIIDGTVYVLGRDQITRLHDQNGDGEADFYENFCNLARTSPGGHDYTTCLETDAAGNFYFLTANEGLQRVSRDGRKIETVATGLRNPNGLGVGPGDVITVSPQEGNWTPASNIVEIRPKGYYGHGGPRVQADRPLGYDPPLCWIPRRNDNSSGGQVWVTGNRWGPLEGQMLHLSYGQCRMMLVLREKLDSPALVQGGTVDFPHTFASGVMRGRFSPHDGQLYVSGLKGWVSSATQDGCLQRVRYTGQAVNLPTRVRTMKNGLAITFSSPLDKQTAEDPDSYHLEQWNYHYSANYGSADFKASNPKQEGHDEVDVASATLLDARTVFLEIPDLKPVMQLSVGYALKARDGVALRQTIQYTIHALGTETMDPAQLVRKPRPGQLTPAEEAALRPGLLAHFEQDGQRDTRDSRLAALFVPAGSAATPFLRPGPFRLVFQGYVRVPLRGEYAFSLRGNGQAALRINGAEILRGRGDLAALAAVRVPLHKGLNLVNLDYEAPAQGDSTLRLYWQGDDFPLEPVPPQALLSRGDDPELLAGTRLRRGRELFASRQCAQCHGLPQGVAAGSSAMPELSARGPDLSEAGARLQPEWVMHWLLDPRAVQNHAAMPRLVDGSGASGRQQAADLAAFLASLKPPRPGVDPAPAEPAKPAAGRILFEDLNCIVCHKLTPPGEKDEYERTSLHFVAAKYLPGRLEAFLQKPHSHFSATRMPDFHLSSAEAGALAAYLRSDAKGTIACQPELAGAEPRRGREHFKTLRCAGCHAIGADEAVPVVALKKKVDSGCLGTELADRKAPDFGLPAADRAALAALLATNGQSLARTVFPEESRRLVQHLRCTSCHSRDAALSPHWSILGDEGRGVAPEPLPHLTWAGEKLRADWTARFLAGSVPYQVRPYLKSRMPSFPGHADLLARGLAAEHGLEPLEAEPLAVDKETAEVGNRLTFKTALDCRQCHAVGREPIQGDDKTQISPGINFAHVRERLRPEFYARFVLDPPRYDPATKMPRFITDLKTTKVTAIYGGDASKQLQAIWQFIQTLPAERGPGAPAPDR